MYGRKWKFSISVNQQITVFILTTLNLAKHRIHHCSQNILGVTPLKLYFVKYLDFWTFILHVLHIPQLNFSRFLCRINICLRNFPPAPLQRQFVRLQDCYDLRVTECSRFRHLFIFLGIPFNRDPLAWKTVSNKIFWLCRTQILTSSTDIIFSQILTFATDISFSQILTLDTDILFLQILTLAIDTFSRRYWH